jgi:CHAT domain-containing protein/tetratricopeptide (TPR) repeat protein
MTISIWLRAFVFAAASSLLMAGEHPLAAQSLPDRLDIGRDSIGEPCVATRSWQSTDGKIKVAADQPFIITCRGVSSARVQGIVKSVVAGDISSKRNCAASKIANMSGAGPVSIRRCYDSSLAIAVVEVQFVRGKTTFIGASAPTALAPLEQTLRAAAGLGLPNPTLNTSTIEVAGLDAAPPAPAQSTTRSEFNAEASLQQGVAMINRGLHVDASRVLNDALSRLSFSSTAGTRIELLLAAGLADSNISQFEAAQAHFRNADATQALNREIELSAFLTSKSHTYRALDLINRRQFVDAIKLLDASAKSIDPLKDPVFLGQLNQGSADAGVAASVSVTDSGQLAWLVIEAQKNWARSVAQLALGQTKASNDALDRAISYVNELRRSVTPSSIIWLRSGIQRQQGRIAAREGKVKIALKSFDCAVITLQGIVQQAGSGCLFSGGSARAGSAAATGPVVAETQLERASLVAQQPGANPVAVLKEYAAAVDTLAASSTANGSVPPALGNYLDLLVKASVDTPSADIDEEFFRAIQTVGEPAIARDLARLQNVVTAEGSIGAKVRDRVELERNVTRLRYEITTLGDSDAVKTKALEVERAAAESALLALNLELGENARYRALDDQPARVADVRGVLRNGEVFLKIAGLRSKLYGIVISTDKTYIYRLLASPRELENIAGRVLKSARSRTTDGGPRIDPFAVEASFALFRAISGPAESTLASAKAIVFDPSGPLRNIPAGILVTNAESVRRHKAQGSKGINDYSQVSFLASKADISTALSPRSFLIVRQKIAASSAPRPFLGLGQNASAPTISTEEGNRAVLSGAGCSISYRNWASITNGNAPISARELGLAASALGIGTAPTIIGAEFSDTALQVSSDAGQLSQYQILHFATHGIPETRYTDEATKCETSLPPSLITTMAVPNDNGGPVSDGLLSFAEVARLNLDANLVVLAACETSSGTSEIAGRLSGQEDSTPTLDGLVRAFITANARAVMATFWRVPAGREGEELLEAFYRSGRTSSIGTALRSAQMTLIKQPQSSHPYYWGAYFVVGDGSKSMLSGDTFMRTDSKPNSSGQ